MNKRNLLLTLHIHRRTQEKYHREHELFVDKQKKGLESIRQEPFEALPQDRQTYYLDLWFWPPWRFNDIVGFAEIELETPWTVIGHLYLPEGQATRVTKKSLLLNYACASANCEPDDLHSLQLAIVDVAEQLQVILSKRKWRLEFDGTFVEHIDFLTILKVRENNRQSDTG